MKFCAVVMLCRGYDRTFHPSTQSTPGEKTAHFKCGVVRFVLVTGGVCHDPPVYWALITKTPERERSRVTFMKGRVL